jgi:hypothetical protein
MLTAAPTPPSTTLASRLPLDPPPSLCICEAETRLRFLHTPSPFPLSPPLITPLLPHFLEAEKGVLFLHKIPPSALPPSLRSLRAHLPPRPIKTAVRRLTRSATLIRSATALFPRRARASAPHPAASLAPRHTLRGRGPPLPSPPHLPHTSPRLDRAPRAMKRRAAQLWRVTRRALLQPSPITARFCTAQKSISTDYRLTVLNCASLAYRYPSRGNLTLPSRSCVHPPCDHPRMRTDSCWRRCNSAHGGGAGVDSARDPSFIRTRLRDLPGRTAIPNESVWTGRTSDVHPL